MLRGWFFPVLGGGLAIALAASLLVIVLKEKALVASIIKWLMAKKEEGKVGPMVFKVSVVGWVLGTGCMWGYFLYCGWGDFSLMPSHMMSRWYLIVIWSAVTLLLAVWSGKMRVTEILKGLNTKKEEYQGIMMPNLFYPWLVWGLGTSCMWGYFLYYGWKDLSLMQSHLMSEWYFIVIWLLVTLLLVVWSGKMRVTEILKGLNTKVQILWLEKPHLTSSLKSLTVKEEHKMSPSAFKALAVVWMLSTGLVWGYFLYGAWGDFPLLQSNMLQQWYIIVFWLLFSAVFVFGGEETRLACISVVRWVFPTPNAIFWVSVLLCLFIFGVWSPPPPFF